MHILRIGAFALSFAAAHASQETSPFYLFSTSYLPNTTPPQQFPAHSLLNYIQDLLSSCSTDTYVIVSQPNVDATDFESPVPPSSLRKIFNENRNIRTSIGVPDVEGRFDTEALQYWLEEKCAAYVWDVQASNSHSSSSLVHPNSQVVRVDFELLPSSTAERDAKLAENDAVLASVLDLLPSDKLTVLYTTTSVGDAYLHPHQTYGRGDPMDIISPEPFSSQELKRDVHVEDPDKLTNSTVRRNAPLFEKYQFFTPGIFMGLLVSFLLISILSVAISAVSSLQVTYAAFEKEMGPSAGKKP